MDTKENARHVKSGQPTLKSVFSAIVGVLVVALFILAYVHLSDINAYYPPADDQMYYGTNEYDEHCFIVLGSDGKLYLTRIAQYGDELIGYDCVYGLKGEYANRLFGSLYYMAGNKSWLGLRYSRDGTVPMNAEMTCELTVSYLANPDVKPGDAYRDTLWFSDDLFVLGEISLNRVSATPDIIAKGMASLMLFGVIEEVE